jgi:homoserine kinase type II
MASEHQIPGKDIDWDELRATWGIAEPSSRRHITYGINNLTQVLATSSGNFILRAYSSDRSLRHIRYELHALVKLQQKNLAFQIPAPILTMTGELFAVFSGVIFTLSPLISGAPPQNAKLEQSQAAGQTLAELVKILANLQVDVTEQSAPFPASGNFEAWAGTKIEPSRLIRSLPLVKDEQSQILALLEITQATAPSLYQTLPQQIIHRDYDQSNILMEDNLVTGVLDFEFCGPDLRILDLAYALTQWPAGLWNTGKEWAVMDSFIQGYFQRQPLTSAELEALPLIFRLRSTTSLFFRFGRYVRGLETPESMGDYIHSALSSESWLQRHEQELMSWIHHWLDI